MATETITVRGDAITLDLLVWRKYRRPIPGLTEQILALNPGLAALGPYLPVGTFVIMPVASQAAEPVAREIVQLWE